MTQGTALERLRSTFTHTQGRTRVGCASTSKLKPLLSMMQNSAMKNGRNNFFSSCLFNCRAYSLLGFQLDGRKERKNLAMKNIVTWPNPTRVFLSQFIHLPKTLIRVLFGACVTPLPKPRNLSFVSKNKILECVSKGPATPPSK